MEDGKPQCLIPFFNAVQHAALHRILDQAFSDIHFKAKANQINEDMIVIWRRDSPSFISDKEIVYKAMVDGSTLFFAVMEDLESKGILPAPAVAEKCRLSTIVWRLPDKA